MKILPAIDIKNGKCVRLTQGDFERERIYNTDPVVVAKQWQSEGATMLHIVDLDGARYGKFSIIRIIENMLENVSILVQVGGGIRTYEDVKKVLSLGVARVILGTIALQDEILLEKIINSYGDKIIVSLDAKNGILMTDGWFKKSNNDLFFTLKKLESIGVQTIIYTDTVRDGTLTEPNYQMLKKLKENTKLQIIVAGGVSNIEHIKKLREMNVDGVIIGTALYEGTINLEKAIEYAS